MTVPRRFLPMLALASALVGLSEAATAQGFDPPVGRDLPSVGRPVPRLSDPISPRIRPEQPTLPDMGANSCRTLLGSCRSGRVEIVGSRCYCRSGSGTTQGTSEPSRRF